MPNTPQTVDSLFDGKSDQQPKTPQQPQPPVTNAPGGDFANWIDSMNGFADRPATYPNKPESVLDQINKMPNSEKLSPLELLAYKTLPGVAQSSTAKAINAFFESPAGHSLKTVATPVGKVLSFLDVGAEALERSLGVLAQLHDLAPGEEWKLKDAWAAGGLFWDTVRLPRLKYDESGWNVTGIEMDTDLPGTYAITEARKLLEQGKSMDDVRELMYGNMGALAMRSQIQDTLGHILGDPLTWALGAVKPVEKLHAIRSLALSGKMDVKAVSTLEKAARAAGNIADADKYAEAIAQAEKSGKALSRLDRFAITMTGGVPYLEKTEEGYKLLDVTKQTKGQKLLAKLNPFALTPQSRASELADMIESHVGQHLIYPNWNKDPEEFIKALSGAARGSINGEWGHLAMTIQGRTVQGLLSNSDAVIKTMGEEWRVYAKERDILSKIAGIMDNANEHTLWQLARDNPKRLFEKITELAGKEGGDVVRAEMQAGNITEQTIAAIGKIDQSVPLMREQFYVKAMASLGDVAVQQSVLQFGVKEKGLLTKWSDALKAWETLPFIKANPANMVRNVVNNDITLVGRGLFGTMSQGDIEQFWSGKYVPSAFKRGFALGSAGEFQAGQVMESVVKTLEGDSKSLPQKIKAAAGKVNLGVADFSKSSAVFEEKASIRAATNGWIQFHQQYWNPKTGFTSVSKALDSEIIDKLEEAIPGITRTLDEVAQSSGADSARFAELMQSNIEHNWSTVVKNTEDGLNYKIDDVLGTETMHVLQEGMPKAIADGTVHEFINSVRTKMEQHVDEMFNKHLENLPGIIQAQVQTGGAMQYHRIFSKALDEFWAGNTEHAIRMSHINELISAAEESGDYSKVRSLWQKVFQDGENHYGRVWKKMDAYQSGLKEGAVAAGLKYPKEVEKGFTDMRKGWQDFYTFRNQMYQDFFEGNVTGKAFDQVQNEISSKFSKMVEREDASFQHIDDAMAEMLPDEKMRGIFTNFRDQVAALRKGDREATQRFYEEVRHADAHDAPDMWQTYWQEKMARVEQIRQMEMQGSAAIQGDPKAIEMFTPQAGEPAKDIYGLANQYGISSASSNGARNDKRILNTINKYAEDQTVKYKNVADVPMDVADKAFQARASTKAPKVAEKAFIPDAEKLLPDPMPIETGLSEMFYGRSYAAMDALAEEAAAQGTKKSALLKDLPEDLQKHVAKWQTQVEQEMPAFRSAGVQFASFRRDSALLNYNRRSNFDSWIGNVAPFAFWTTHSVMNWGIHSIDRPAMLTTYFRMRKFAETAGLTDQNVPSRMRGHIRVQLPFTPDWMGDTFVNPGRFLLPFDAWMSPWEQAHQSKFTQEGKADETLKQMLDNGDITEADYNNALTTRSGDAWEKAMSIVQEGSDSFDAMDFVNMTMTPHAPLMWAYNAARGQKNEIGAFTPMTKTVKNLATVMGVKDWSNHPYNIEARIRREMGLPAFDKWDDYRIAREISNMAVEGKYDMEKVKEAMQVAALVESGKMSQVDAKKQSELYTDAITRSNQEQAGGIVGTALGILGIPLKSYPEGEAMQRDLADQFHAAYVKYDNGDVNALTNFFDDHPQYEARLALFKKPEERLQSFMVDNIWARWNDMPKVNQDELKAQLGDEFANKFINKETRSYETIDPLQMQVWLKLMGGKPVGSLTADQEVMTELAHLKFTDPETAWRVQTFYSMRGENFPHWSELQNKYYNLPEQQRKDFLNKNPELKGYWDSRKQWMTKNPDLVRFLTDDEKTLKKYLNIKRDPQVAVPNADEIRSRLSQPTLELVNDWAGGQTLPYSVERYLEQLATSYGMNKRELLGVLTGK